jgi:hypothetical protein
MPVSVCMCMYLYFCFAQDAKEKRLLRPGPGALQCEIKKGIKCRQKCSDDSGTRTPIYRVTYIILGYLGWISIGYVRISWDIIVGYLF